MSICCVTVTYGNRFRYLSHVVHEALRQGVQKIVIADNASGEPSKSQLQELVNTNKDIFHYHRFNENEGSAKGFRTALELALDQDCEFIWMLDDDNLPEENALSALMDFWKEKKYSSHDMVALASYRKDRQHYIHALQTRDPDALLWPRNSFMGFHIRQLFGKIGARIQKKRYTSASKDLATPMKLNAGGFGGLFFHRELLEKIGLPEEKWVLYNEDFWFTSRITENKGDIWMLPQSRIADIDTSFYAPSRKGILYHSSLDGKNDSLVYYTTRNAVYYLKHHLVTNRPLYLFNKLIFLTLISSMALLRGKLERLSLIYKAIRHGERGKLGKHPAYPLAS
jgi:GT2 family glycosyltransferase